MPNVFIPADARLQEAEQSHAVRPHAASKAHYGVLATFRSLLEFLVVALFALGAFLQWSELHHKALLLMGASPIEIFGKSSARITFGPWVV